MINITDWLGDGFCPMERIQVTLQNTKFKGHGFAILMFIVQLCQPYWMTSFYNIKLNSTIKKVE